MLPTKSIKQVVLMPSFLLAVTIGLVSILSGCQEKNQQKATTIQSPSPAAAVPDANAQKKVNGVRATPPTKIKTIDLGNEVIIDFILIPSGEFSMGSPETEKDRNANEGPVHKVKISKSFYISKYEVTQDQYMAVTGTNPSSFTGKTRPVENVSWEDANNFCVNLSSKYSGSFRLPTEAEWEYACRAGTTTRFYYGNDSDYSDLGSYGWYSKDSLNISHPVGQKKPNMFVLYDMHGNVWEWCSDWYDAEYYKNATNIDPKGPSSGQGRVLRGGGWLNNPGSCRSANRIQLTPTNKSPYFGFRVVLDVN